MWCRWSLLVLGMTRWLNVIWMRSALVLVSIMLLSYGRKHVEWVFLFFEESSFVKKLGFRGSLWCFVFSLSLSFSTSRFMEDFPLLSYGTIFVPGLSVLPWRNPTSPSFEITSRSSPTSRRIGLQVLRGTTNISSRTITCLISIWAIWLWGCLSTIIILSIILPLLRIIVSTVFFFPEWKNVAHLVFCSELVTALLICKTPKLISSVRIPSNAYRMECSTIGFTSSVSSFMLTPYDACTSWYLMSFTGH